MDKTYRIVTSERCYRYKLEALENHAPAIETVYEIVTFDQTQTPKVLYVGLAWDKDLHQSLSEHLEGKAEPKVQELLKSYPDIYFDYVLPPSGISREDLQDIYWALVHKHNPPCNKESISHSGRYSNIQLEEQ